MMKQSSVIKVEDVINEVPWRFMPIWGTGLRVGVNLETKEVAFCVRTLEQTTWFDDLGTAIREYDRVYNDGE